MQTIDRKKKPETLVTMSISNNQLERLKTRCNVTQAGWGFNGYRLDEDTLCEMIKQSEILLSGYEIITSRVIQSAKNLKLIGVTRSNPVNVDISTANDRGIPILYTPGRNSLAVAEFTIGLILSQVRQITRSDRALRTGRFLGKTSDSLFSENPDRDVIWNLDGENPYNEFRGIELHGRTLGLIGMGKVASQVAILALAFGMKVITYTPTDDFDRANHLGIQMVELHDLLHESDVISVHCKVTPETIGMLDENAFLLMKPSAYLINTARAIIIDQQALIQALQNKQIAGAALDVYWWEPLPVNHPLLCLENITLTPHLGGSTNEVPERHSRMIIDDVLNWLTGERPKYLLNPEIYSN